MGLSCSTCAHALVAPGTGKHSGWDRYCAILILVVIPCKIPAACDASLR